MLEKLLARWTGLFVLWVLLFSIAAYLVPRPFAALAPGIVPGLGLIMFGMGMTLVPADFVRVAKMPRAVLCGVVGQFLIMPLAGLFLAKAITGPLRKATEIASSGDISARLNNTSQDEVGQLCRAFDDLAERLERKKYCKFCRKRTVHKETKK